MAVKITGFTVKKNGMHLFKSLVEGVQMIENEYSWINITNERFVNTRFWFTDLQK